MAISQFASCLCTGAAGLRWGVVALGLLISTAGHAHAEDLDPVDLEVGSNERSSLWYGLPNSGYYSLLNPLSVGENDANQILKSLSLTYFGMVSSPTFQGEARGSTNLFFMRNFLGAGYRLSESITFSGNAFWSVRGAQTLPTQFHDPFFRLSDSAVLSGDHWSLYLDGRVHLPLSTPSLMSGLTLGLQSVQALTYHVPESRFTLGLSTSFRYNLYQPRGFGNEMDFYLGPTLFYQLTPSIGLNVLSEGQMSLLKGGRRSDWTFPTFDLEPGVVWDLMQNLSLSPYIHIPVGGKGSWVPTYAGLILNWTLL